MKHLQLLFYFFLLTFHLDVSAQVGAAVTNINEVDCPDCGCSAEDGEGSTITFDDGTSDGVTFETTDFGGSSVVQEVQNGTKSSLTDVMSDGLEGDAAVFAAEEIGMLMDMFVTVNELAIPLFVADFLYEVYEEAGEDMSQFTCYYLTRGLGLVVSDIEAVCVSNLNSALKFLGVKHYWEELNDEVNLYLGEAKDSFSGRQTTFDYFSSSYIPGQFHVQLNDLNGDVNRISAVLTGFPEYMNEDYLRDYLQSNGLDEYVDTTKEIESDNMSTEDSDYFKKMYSNEYALSKLKYYNWESEARSSQLNFEYEIPDVTFTTGNDYVHGLTATFTQEFYYNGELWNSHWLKEWFMGYFPGQEFDDEDIEIGWSIDRVDIPVVFALARMNGGELEILDELPYSATLSDDGGYMISIKNYEIEEDNKSNLFIVSYIEAYDSNTFLIDNYRGIISSDYGENFAYLCYFYEFGGGHSNEYYDSELGGLTGLGGEYSTFIDTYYEGMAEETPFPGGVGKEWDINEINIKHRSWTGDKANSYWDLIGYNTYNPHYLKYLIEEPQLTKRILMISPFSDFVNRTDYMNMAQHDSDGNETTSNPGWLPEISTYSSYTNLSDPEIGNVHMKVDIPMSGMDKLKIQNLSTPDQMILIDLGDGPSGGHYPGYYAKAQLIKSDQLTGEVTVSDLPAYWLSPQSGHAPFASSDQTAAYPDENTRYYSMIIENVSNYVTNDMIVSTYADNYGNIVTSPSLITVATELKRDYYSFAKQDGSAGLSGNYLEIQSDGTVLLSSVAPASGTILTDPMDGGYILMDKATGKALTVIDASDSTLGFTDYYRDDTFVWIPDYEADDDLVFYNLGWDAYLSVDANNKLVLDSDEFLELEILRDDVDDPVDILEFEADAWLFSRGARALVDEEMTLHRFDKDQDLSYMDANFTIEYYGAEQYSIRNGSYQYLTIVDDGSDVSFDWLSYYGTLGVGFTIEEYEEYKDKKNYITIKSVDTGLYLKADDYNNGANLTVATISPYIPLDGWWFHFELLEDTDTAPDIFPDRAYYNIKSPEVNFSPNGQNFWYEGEVLIDPMDDGHFILMDGDNQKILQVTDHTKLLTSSQSSYTLAEGWDQEMAVDSRSDAQEWLVYQDRGDLVFMSAIDKTYAQISSFYFYYGELHFTSDKGSLFTSTFSRKASDIVDEQDYVIFNVEDKGFITPNPTQGVVYESYDIDVMSFDSLKFTLDYVGALQYTLTHKVSGNYAYRSSQNQLAVPILTAEFGIDPYDTWFLEPTTKNFEYQIRQSTSDKYIASFTDHPNVGVLDQNYTAGNADYEWFFLEVDEGSSALDAHYQDPVTVGNIDAGLQFTYKWPSKNIKGVVDKVQYPSTQVLEINSSFDLSYEGYLYVTEDDFFEFAISAVGDPGNSYKLYLHDELVYEHQYGLTTYHVKGLKAGYHPLRLEMGNHNYIPTSIQLMWESVDKDWEEVPATAFYRDHLSSEQPNMTTAGLLSGLYGWTFSGSDNYETLFLGGDNNLIPETVQAVSQGNGQAPGFSPSANMSYVYQGYLEVPSSYDNQITLVRSSKDPMRMYLDDVMVFDSEMYPGEGVHFLDLILDKDKIYRIRIEMGSTKGGITFLNYLKTSGDSGNLNSYLLYEKVPFLNEKDVLLKATTDHESVDNVDEYRLAYLENCQSWNIYYASDGYYRIQCSTTNEFLKLAKNAPVKLGSWPQPWDFRFEDEDVLRIFSLSGDKYLGSDLDGSLVPSSTYTTNTNPYFEIAKPEPFGEVGKVTISDDWQTFSMQNTYVDPILILGPPSINGTQKVLTRLRNINGSSRTFEAKLQEWEYMDGDHFDEDIWYMIVEAGTHAISNGSQTEYIYAGKENINYDYDNGDLYTDVTIDKLCDGELAVLTQLGTFEGTDPAVARINRLSYLSDFSQATFRMFVLEEFNLYDKFHAQEEGHFIAFSEGDVSSLMTYLAKIENSFAKNNWKQVSLSSGNFTDPVADPGIFASPQSTDELWVFDPLFVRAGNVRYNSDDITNQLLTNGSITDVKFKIDVDEAPDLGWGDAETYGYIPPEPLGIVVFDGLGSLYKWPNSSVGSGARTSGLWENDESDTEDVSTLPEKSSHASVYPNPTSGEVVISLTLESAALVQIELLEISGKHVLERSFELQTGNQNIRLGNLPDLGLRPGIYFVQVSTGSFSEQIKLILE